MKKKIKKLVRPIEIITKEKDKFINEVSGYTYDKITSTINDKDSLKNLINYTIISEKRKIKSFAYSFDPEDDKEFWNTIEEKFQKDNIEVEGYKAIVRTIIDRYVNEIYTPFSKIKYWFLKQFTTIFIKVIYKPFKFFNFGKKKETYRDYLKILGNYDLISKLGHKVTMVYVPTHVSHFDHQGFGAAIVDLNNIKKTNLFMPIFGGGFNLYEYKIFKYWVSKCGMYSIDRRKPNRIYIETLKIYYKSLMMKGCNSLFYPGGTRSRDGSVERSLKKGLLSSPIETQKFAYDINGPEAKKIVVVPVTLNYESVFEAENLIEEYLKEYIRIKKKKMSFFDKIKLGHRLIRRGCGIRAIFGNPMDTLGNKIDVEGNSFDDHGNKIDLYKEIKQLDSKLERNKIKDIGSKILKQYRVFNYIFPSQIIAKASFDIIKKRYEDLSEKEFWNMDFSKIRISHNELKKKVKELYESMVKIPDPPYFDEEIKNIDKKDINYLIRGLGVFHSRKPLLPAETGYVRTESLMLLFYYANRLSIYGI